MHTPCSSAFGAQLARAADLPTHLWLASKSPRRLALLRTLGIEPTVFLAQQGEQAEALEEVQQHEAPVPYVQRVTRLKLDSAMRNLKQHTPELVLAADTTVALGNTILGKPENAEQARAMLHLLSGQTHQVHTAVAVGNLISHAVACVVQTSEVEFATLPATFIEAYIASGEPFDKAGGYGIQGVIAQYVRTLSGSHSGIMGLPLHETATLLKTLATPHPHDQRTNTG
ncbi:MAG: septum formation protein Maf [Limnobacter sp.]|nr:septum formation protein Maf [Limnobacter sp.]